MKLAEAVTYSTKPPRSDTPMLLDVLKSDPPEFLPMPSPTFRLVISYRLPSASYEWAVKPAGPLLVEDLGWTREEAAAVRAQLATFAEDWEAPEMDAYDAL